jgi:hypothetical protein
MRHYDFFCKWATEADAKADAVMVANQLGVTPSKDWMLDHTLPNVQVWRPSQDVHNPDGTVTHNYLTGWFAIVSVKTQLPELMSLAATQFVLDRDACTAGQPFVILNNIGAVIRDVAVSPIFAGSTYPMGGFGVKQAAAALLGNSGLIAQPS